jgi:hypothetical protein
VRGGSVLGLLPRAPGASNGHVDPNATDNQSLRFPAYRPLGRQAVAAWDHAGIFFSRANLRVPG